MPLAQPAQSYSYNAPSLEALLPPVVPAPHVASPRRQQRLHNHSNRFKRQQSMLGMLGGIIFSLFLLFGTVQIGRALVENVGDLIKLSAESDYIEQAHVQSVQQRKAFKSQINFYNSSQGTESLIRNYLNATYPNEILVTLQ